jgi:excisionase family DNA binding protein
MSESLRLLLTAEEAAEELRIARSRVFDLMAAGELPSVKIGRSRRITRAALEYYVETLVEAQSGSGTTQQPQPTTRPDPRPSTTRPDPRPTQTRPAASGRGAA